MVIARRFYPPWCDGAVSYTKGLVDAILALRKLGADVQLTILGLTDILWFRRWRQSDLTAFKKIPANIVVLDGARGNPENITRIFLQKYSDPIHVVHVTYPGLDPLSVRIALSRKNASFFWVLKHLYMTPLSNGVSSISHRMLDIFSKGKLLKLKTIFSSDYLENWYGGRKQRVKDINQTNIIPPAIDTERFRRIKITTVDPIKEIFLEEKTKNQDLDFIYQSDYRIIYFGPLIHERCRYDLILKAISRLKKDGISSIGVMMVGRGFEDLQHMSQIKEYASKVGLNDRIALTSKPLTEAQKIILLNYADVVLQPYPFHPRRMSIVDPPITILEAMAAERKVIVSGLKGLQDTIDHRSNGFVLNNLEVASLEETLLEALTTRNSIGVDARKTIVNNFSLQVVAKKLLKLYGSLGIYSR